jgi:hypothetical protein
MASETDWYPATRAQQRIMYANVLAKVGNYKDVINGLDTALVGRIELMCRMYIALYDWLAEAEAALGGSYLYQKDMERGELSEAVSPVPMFPALVLPTGAFKGFVKEFRDEIGLLKKQDGFTPQIGRDLMIVRLRGDSISPEQRQPDFKYEVRQGYRLFVTGSLQGMRAANFYYRRKGQTEWISVGYLTRTPGEIHIPPAVAGEPETGDIRAFFAENNVQIGLVSDNTEITLS